MFKLIFLSISLAAVLGFAASSDWNYDPESIHGPHNWKDIEGSYCGGLKQSPIDIVIPSARRVSSHKQLEMVDCEKKPESIIYTNTGHGFNLGFSFSNNANPYLVSGPFGTEKYVFSGAHFHWISEHTLNGSSFPAELHLVHYNKKYGSLQAALGQADGLAVLGFLIAQSDSKRKNTVQHVIQFATQVSEAYSTATMTSNIFSLFDVIKAKKFSVYSYPGSLTTPGCNEIVTWLVAKQTISLTSEELAIFRTIKDSHGHFLLRNNRPVQPLNGRGVKFYP